MEQEYKMEATCQWCLKRPTGNKTYAQYMLRGNICSFCSATYADAAKMSMSSTEKQVIYRRMDEHRKNMELLAEGLSMEITEEDRKLIEFKMKQEYELLKEARKELW